LDAAVEEFSMLWLKMLVEEVGWTVKVDYTIGIL
jgi:hypothetical protein